MKYIEIDKIKIIGDMDIEGEEFANKLNPQLLALFINTESNLLMDIGISLNDYELISTIDEVKKNNEFENSVFALLLYELGYELGSCVIHFGDDEVISAEMIYVGDEDHKDLEEKRVYPDLYLAIWHAKVEEKKVLMKKEDFDKRAYVFPLPINGVQPKLRREDLRKIPYPLLQGIIDNAIREDDYEMAGLATTEKEKREKEGDELL